MFEGKFECSKFNCTGCNDGLVDGEQPKRNWKFKSLTKTSSFKIINPLNRFTFRLTGEIGSGGFAYVYEGFYHGVKRAFKFIPLDKQKHENDIKSYGCHEYYQQDGDK